MKVLIVEDKENYLELLKDILDSEGIENVGVLKGKDAVEKIRRERFSAIVTDLFLPDIDGFKILEEVKKRYPELPVIIITAFSSIERAVEAIKKGAYDFIPKPFEPEHLILKLKKAVEAYNLKISKEAYAEKFESIEIIGQSELLKKALEKLESVALTDSSVLLLGESGTGKELFAKKLHFLSKRRDFPFLSINCASIPEKLLETELFGYEKGAFTGAYKTKRGKLEIAHQGTVFLDEIGDLPIELQPKLLKVLEEKSFERVGGTEKISVDVRFVFATNKDLREEVRKGNFREDLFFRISVFPVEIPSLRERREDIPLLVEYFIKKIGDKINKRVKGISPEALRILKEYEWRGNIRELQNTIERAIIVSDGKLIDKKDIFLYREEPELDFSGTLSDVLERVERFKIVDAIKKFGDKKKAAEYLGINYKTLQSKISKYKIES